MPTPQSAHRSPPHQLVLPFDLPKPPVAIPHSPALIQVAPQQVWSTLTHEQRSDLRHQLIQILPEVLRHANQY
jgi:hypothetical protein